MRDRVEPRAHRDHADETAPRVHARIARGQRNAAAVCEHPEKHDADQPAVEHQLGAGEPGRGDLHAHTHRREDQCAQHHPKRLHSSDLEVRVEAVPIVQLMHLIFHCDLAKPLASKDRSLQRTTGSSRTRRHRRQFYAPAHAHAQRCGAARRGNPIWSDAGTTPLSRARSGYCPDCRSCARRDEHGAPHRAHTYQRSKREGPRCAGLHSF